MKRILITLVLVAPTAACTVGEVGMPAPAAPTELQASLVTGAAHLTWKDNSTDEMHFMVMRMTHDHDAHGGGEMTPLATVDANATEYHDGSITSGMTYMYMVAAMNDGGESDSNEIELAAP